MTDSRGLSPHSACGLTRTNHPVLFRWIQYNTTPCGLQGVVQKYFGLLCHQLFQRGEAQARREDLHCLLQLFDRRQGRRDADVGILRVDPVRERRARLASPGTVLQETK